jgi:hypothetical protein
MLNRNLTNIILPVNRILILRDEVVKDEPTLIKPSQIMNQPTQQCILSYFTIVIILF